jgi:hypothetical protein
MLTRRILVKGLLFQFFPAPEGETFREGKSFFINGKPLPNKWSLSDWQEVEVGSRVEYCCHVAYRVGGVVSEVSWEASFGKVPYLRVTEGQFQGNQRELEKGSLGPFGTFEVLTYEGATVEPEWLFPKGTEISWRVYQSILAYLGDWKPFRQLSLSELWGCVKYAVDYRLSWSPENLITALSVEGNFALPCEVRKVHDALRLASRIKEDGWPEEEPEEGSLEEEPKILNLWFDLATQRYLWVAPDSVFQDEIGLACAQFCREELSQDVSSLALKLLFPAKEPFFSVKGQVFESTSGPF